MRNINTFMRYFFQLSYAGTNYHGWQKQPNANTVQAEIEKALCLILGLPEIETTGCGRTDTGVHASDFYFHVDIASLKPSVDDLKFKLNRLLPNDIAIANIHNVADTAHARFDATSREYRYFVHHQKNPFLDKTSVYLHRIPNYEKMNEAARLLLLHTDFACFCKANANSHTTICKVSAAKWVNTQNGWFFEIKADRFLRNMVRAIVGTLLDVGYEKIPVQQVEEILQSKSRTEAGESVPAHGLFLCAVKYPYL